MAIVHIAAKEKAKSRALTLLVHRLLTERRASQAEEITILPFMRPAATTKGALGLPRVRTLTRARMMKGEGSHQRRSFAPVQWVVSEAQERQEARARSRRRSTAERTTSGRRSTTTNFSWRSTCKAYRFWRTHRELEWSIILILRISFSSWARAPSSRLASSRPSRSLMVDRHKLPTSGQSSTQAAFMASRLEWSRKTSLPMLSCG